MVIDWIFNKLGYKKIVHPRTLTEEDRQKSLKLRQMRAETKIKELELENARLDKEIEMVSQQTPDELVTSLLFEAVNSWKGNMFAPKKGEKKKAKYAGRTV